jgi:hypothetical protein
MNTSVLSGHPRRIPPAFGEKGDSGIIGMSQEGSIGLGAFMLTDVRINDARDDLTILRRAVRVSHPLRLGRRTICVGRRMIEQWAGVPVGIVENKKEKSCERVKFEEVRPSLLTGSCMW